MKTNRLTLARGIGLAVSVEPVLADSIEILRGPATLLYGGGAIGGVVNVIDKRVPVALPEQLTGAVEMRHASVSDENTGVFRLDWGLGNWAFHLDGLKRESNNLDIPGLANHHASQEEEHDELENGRVGTQWRKDSWESRLELTHREVAGTACLVYSSNRLNWIPSAMKLICHNQIPITSACL